MKCQICEYSVSRQNIYNKEGFHKKYNFCIHCGQKFENIIQSKLSDFIEKLSLQKEKKTDSGKSKLKFILQNTDNVNFVIQELNKIFDTEIENLKNIIKNIKPFENIEVYNYDETFYCFTSLKKMNKLLRKNLIDKLSDNKIKFKQYMDDAVHTLVIKQTIKKKNECINCKKEEYLKKIFIFPDTNVNKFFQKYVSIHFWYAVCTKCEDYCKNKIHMCGEDVKKEIGKTCIEYINELCETKNFEEMQKFIDYYFNFYQSMPSKKSSTGSSPELFLSNSSRCTPEQIESFSYSPKFIPSYQMFNQDLNLSDESSPFSPILLSPTSSINSLESDDLICELILPKFD